MLYCSKFDKIDPAALKMITGRQILYISIIMQLSDSFMKSGITRYLTEAFGILAKKRKGILIPVFNP